MSATTPTSRPVLIPAPGPNEAAPGEAGGIAWADAGRSATVSSTAPAAANRRIKRFIISYCAWAGKSKKSVKTIRFGFFCFLHRVYFCLRARSFLLLYTHSYTVGKISSERMVAVIRSPMMTMASGFLGF